MELILCSFLVFLGAVYFKYVVGYANPLVFKSKKQKHVYTQGNFLQDQHGTTVDVKNRQTTHFAWLPKLVNFSNAGSRQVYIWLESYYRAHRDFVEVSSADSQPRIARVVRSFKMFDFYLPMRNHNGEILTLDQALNIISDYNKNPKKFSKGLLRPHSTLIVNYHQSFPKGINNFESNLRYLMLMNDYCCKQMWDGNEVVPSEFLKSIESTPAVKSV